MNNILYKYRSLTNFKNFVDIILNDRLFAAQFDQLNDIREGLFNYYKDELSSENVRKIKNEKQNHRICSLSKSNILDNMWSLYADSHKGIAIGVVIDPVRYIVKEMRYSPPSILKDEDLNELTAVELLTRKSDNWKSEQEIRAFAINENFINVTVKEIILGENMGKSDAELVTKLVSIVNPQIEIIDRRNV